MAKCRASINFEQEILQETVGSQDQVLAAYGGLNHVTFHENGEISVRPVTLARERIDELDSHLLLFYTGIKRTAADVAKSYVDDLEARKRQLRIMRDLVEEAVAILNSRRALKEFGSLLHEAWQAKRSLSPAVTNSDVDTIYDTARATGALGGKLTGAGGGGFMLLFAPPDQHDAIRAKLNKLIHVPFRFDYNGSQIIFLDREVDYSVAERQRAEQAIDAFRELSTRTT
jgi:D-glycero-alpha-D-manno-heptose-7-phosphate kinase